MNKIQKKERRLFFYIFVAMHSALATSELPHNNSDPILPVEVVCLIGSSFNSEIKPHEAKTFLTNMWWTNRALRQAIRPYIHDANYTRILINKISSQRNQNQVAKILNFPGAKKYLNINEPLYRQILTYSEKTIERNITTKGGDPNFFPIKQKPLLFKALSNYQKTKMLLELDANPNVEFNNKTPLHIAIENDNIQLMQLLLHYHPNNKCLDFAIKLDKEQLIDLIVTMGNPSQDDIHRGFTCAWQQLNVTIAEYLLCTGMNPSNHLREAVLTLRRYYYKKQHNQVATLLKIVKLMCQHGAWDSGAYSIAHGSKHIPAQLLEYLDKGREIARAKVLKK